MVVNGPIPTMFNMLEVRAGKNAHAPLEAGAAVADGVTPGRVHLQCGTQRTEPRLP